jgi:hypothetical protein
VATLISRCMQLELINASATNVGVLPIELDGMRVNRHFTLNGCPMVSPPISVYHSKSSSVNTKLLGYFTGESYRLLMMKSVYCSWVEASSQFIKCKAVKKDVSKMPR